MNDNSTVTGVASVLRTALLIGALMGFAEALTGLLRGGVRTAAVVSFEPYHSPASAIKLIAGAIIIYGAIAMVLVLALLVGRTLFAKNAAPVSSLTATRVVVGSLLFLYGAVWWNQHVLKDVGVSSRAGILGTLACLAVSWALGHVAGGVAVRTLDRLTPLARLAIGAALAIVASLTILLTTTDRHSEVVRERMKIEPTGAARTSLVVVTLDTTRADRLGPYGGSDFDTPTLQDLTDRGVLFTDVVAQTPLTAPNHASLFTSTYPRSHGVLTNGRLLASSYETLAEVLLNSGYRTAAFVSAIPLQKEVSFLDQGFETYDQSLSRFDPFLGLTAVRVASRLIGNRLLERTADATTDSALKWAETVSPQEPYFLWVHYFDPHHPYRPPSSYRTPISDTAGEVAREIALYDGEIRFVDAQLGRLLAELRAQGLLNKALVVVTADHGESLGEHSYFFDHGHYLYEPSLRVPLVMVYPGVLEPGSVVDGVVETVDLMPTILDLLEIPGPEEMQGDVVPTPTVGRAGRTTHEGGVAYSQTLQKLSDRRTISLFSVRDNRLKYLVKPQLGEEELYDLVSDPGETLNLASSDRESVESLGRMLAEWLERTEPGEAENLQDPDVLEKLEALGYLN